MVRTAILKIDNASSILAAPNSCGELAEWSIATVSRTVEVRASVSSNLTLPAYVMSVTY